MFSHFVRLLLIIAFSWGANGQIETIVLFLDLRKVILSIVIVKSETSVLSRRIEREIEGLLRVGTSVLIILESGILSKIVHGAISIS